MNHPSGSNLSLNHFGVKSEYLPFRICNEYLSAAEATALLEHCLAYVPWQTEQVKMFGRSSLAPRLSCSIGASGLQYRYNGSQGVTAPWTAELNQLRSRLSTDLKTDFNFLLANQYRNGSDYVGWHADDEPDLVVHGTIASLSLGATREFRFRENRTKEVTSFTLTHGTLLLMSGQCQSQFKHTLVKTQQRVDKRVNLSFRCVVPCSG